MSGEQCFCYINKVVSQAKAANEGRVISSRRTENERIRALDITFRNLEKWNQYPVSSDLLFCLVVQQTGQLEPSTK